MTRALIILLLFIVSSCSLTKVSFWEEFKKDYLKENISDQGLHGGRTAMYWTTEKAHTFKPNEVINYAIQNGWELIDSLEFSRDNLKSWYLNNSPIFPLSHEGFSPYSEARSIYKHFPRWMIKEIKVYTFKTGIIMIEPGTDNSFEINGFVVINHNGTEMSVYHLWGE